nr:hypothetical protein CFP56_78565 [Quercus suber]
MWSRDISASREVVVETQPTKRCPIPHVLSQQVARTDRRELWESLQHPLRLCTFPNPGRTHQDDTGCSSKLHVGFREWGCDWFRDR